jgi:hypothetical protein
LIHFSLFIFDDLNDSLLLCSGLYQTAVVAMWLQSKKPSKVMKGRFGSPHTNSSLWGQHLKQGWAKKNSVRYKYYKFIIILKMKYIFIIFTVKYF